MIDEKDLHVIEQIRKFNRFYTPLIGILDRNYLSSGYSVTENRILFELHKHAPLSVKYLCNLLNLDKSYISRLITGFEKKGLIQKTTSPHDARSQDIFLTEYGEAETMRVINITNEKIWQLVKRLDEQECNDVCQAMQCIEERLTNVKEEQV